MFTTMSEAYLEAMTKSYANQEGGITIPANKLGEVVTIPLGFQPLGITSLNNRIAIAAYFEPAICLTNVTRNEQGLHFQVAWIRGVDHGIESIRLFPDISQPGGANRAQSVNFGPDDTIWVSRNIERDFFILSPPNPGLERWSLIDRISLPHHEDEYMSLGSALIDLNKNIIYTIEYTADIENFYFCSYSLKDKEIIFINKTQIPSWMGGIGKQPSSDNFWLVTDYRSKEKHGIYKLPEIKCVVPEIYGNSICFLEDGSALVTRYGQSSPGAFNGEPGALIYVPAKFFE